jgi:radical S-adenosyl methionine domain-containing protein 2
MEGFNRDEEQLSKDKGLELIKKLHDFGMYKINFAGGEPLLNQHLSEYIKYSRSLGLKVSIISNAARMTNSWIIANCPHIDQVGISCDSLNDDVQKSIGRGFGNHVDITRRALTRINKFNEDFGMNVNVKLNTVVMRQNYQEDWSDFLLEHGVKRWKVFKILLIKGENDEFYNESYITDEQF